MSRDPNLTMVVHDALNSPRHNPITADMLRDLYINVIGSWSPRRGAQHVAAMLYRMETGDTTPGIDHPAFTDYEETLRRNVWDVMNERRQFGNPNG